MRESERGKVYRWRKGAYLSFYKQKIVNLCIFLCFLVFFIQTLNQEIQLTVDKSEIERKNKMQDLKF